MPDQDSEGLFLAQVLSTMVLAQNSCAIHERCDSSCPGRIGSRRYVQRPDGTRAHEVDQRAQLAAAAAAASSSSSTGQQQQVRTEPLTVPETAPAFVYQPLKDPNSTMRLLKIKQAIFRADPVDCELVEVPMGQAPSYGALSYCWGNGPDDCKILCNGAVFNGRPSLERALKRLRAGFEPGQIEAYLWADAICINQQDLAEKGAQIARMDRIYFDAATVYVDLGGVEGQQMSFAGHTLIWGEGGGMGLQDSLTASDNPAHPFTYKTIFHALTQPYFSRTWVIQELALAQKVKYMFHGRIFTPADMDAVLDRRALQAHPERLRELMTINATMMGFLNYSKMKEMRDMWRGGRDIDTLRLMQLTRDFVATEPKDKIFGILALMTKADRDVIGPYSQSVETVYRKFATLQVLQGRTIAILDCAGLQRRQGVVSSEPGNLLPSWVPDWTAQRPSPKPISTLRPVPYLASWISRPSATVIDTDGETSALSVRGYIFDTLQILVHAEQPSPERPDPGFLSFHDRIRPVYDSYFADAKNDDIFARLLLMDDTYIGRNAIAYSSPILDPATTYHAALRAWRSGNPTARPSGKMSPVQTFQMQADTTRGERSFGITSAGLVALVPRVSEIGDVVGIICGATVPVVLRRVEQGQSGNGAKYKLVGDAYVHGVMGGEMWFKYRGRAAPLILV